MKKTSSVSEQQIDVCKMCGYKTGLSTQVITLTDDTEDDIHDLVVGLVYKRFY